MSEHIHVYADWQGLHKPQHVGVLESNRVRGNEIFNFSYDGDWLTSRHAQQIDPHLHLYRGVQYNDDSDRNFKAFLDSCPDR